MVSLARLGRIEKAGRIGDEHVFGKSKEKRYRLSEFGELCALRGREESRLADSTIETLLSAVASLRESVGDKYIHAYSDDDVKKWDFRMQNRGLSKTTRSMYGRSLKAAFNRGKEWGITNSNPFENYRWPTTRETRRRRHSMSVDEIEKLLDTIDKDPKESQFGLYVRVGWHTGKRRSELLALQGKDIDVEKRTLRFLTLKRKEGPVTTLVPMGDALYRILRSISLEDEEYLFKTNARKKTLREEGRPWSKWWVTHHFRDLLQRAGLPDHYTLHSLRRSYTNYLLQSGVPRDVVRKMLGQGSSVAIDEYDETEAIDYRSYVDKLSFGDTDSTKKKSK